jgi:hypothetical protein
MIPQYIITAGAMTADSSSLTDSGLPVALRVDLRLNQINTAEIRLGLVPGDAVAVGDAVTIELGDADDGTEKVFTGIVTELRQQMGGYTIWCSSALQSLSRLRVNKTYEQQKAGDIVSDIAGIASLGTGNVESGLTYPFYAIGADRHLAAHAQALAARDGFDFFTDADDALVFAAYAADPSHELRYGAEIIAYFCEEQAAQVEGVEVYGESPASLGQGDKAYSWLTKEDVKGNAGNSSGNVLRVADPSIRNQDAAGTAAEKLLAAMGTKKKGWVEALGTPGPVLGGAITLTDLPDGGPSGSFKITGIRHQLDKQRGFITTVFWKEE